MRDSHGDMDDEEFLQNMNNVNNVVIRNNDGAYVITFHMPGNHVVPATVDESTAARIHEELGELK